MSPHQKGAPDLFSAIGDASRRKILELLATREHSVGELADALGIAQPSVSQHLTVLRSVGLVTVARRGTSSICRLEREPLTTFIDWITALERTDSRYR